MQIILGKYKKQTQPRLLIIAQFVFAQRKIDKSYFDTSGIKM